MLAISKATAAALERDHQESEARARVSKSPPASARSTGSGMTAQPDASPERGAAAASVAPLAAPKWEDDSSRDSCPVCDTKFSVLVRKNHCRLCGLLVCGPCSVDRVIVKEWGEDVQQRCCRLCFETKASGHPSVTKLQPVSPRGLSGQIQGSLSKINSKILSRGSGRETLKRGSKRDP